MMKILGQNTYWYQCIIDVSKRQEEPIKKIKAMMEELRSSTQKAIDKMRTLAATKIIGTLVQESLSADSENQGHSSASQILLIMLSEFATKWRAGGYNHRRDKT